MVKKMEITQHAKYTCVFCGKVSVIFFSVHAWKKEMQEMVEGHSILYVAKNLSCRHVALHILCSPSILCGFSVIETAILN